MASGFYPIESILGRSTSSIAQWPTWDDLDADAVPSDPGVIDSVVARLKARRLCIIEAPQAHRKTVTAKLIGFTLAKEGWATWYAEADNLDHSAAARQISELDQTGILFIIDDAHKAAEELEALVPLIGNLSGASCLVLTRPILHSRQSSGDSFLELARTAGLVQDLAVRKTLVESMIGIELRRRSRVSAPVGDISQSDIARLMALAGNDLEIINWLLKNWSIESGQPLRAVLDEEHLLRFVVLRRLNSAGARETLLPLAALSQFEIPSQVTFLPRIDGFIANGTALLAPSPSKGRGVFVRLQHPSLAQLYLRAAHRHGFIRDATIDEYTVGQLASYLEALPINYRGVFRSLDVSSRFDLAISLVGRAEVVVAIKAIAVLDETPLVACLGLVGYVARVSPVIAAEVLEDYLQSHSTERVVNEMCRLTMLEIGRVWMWLKLLPRNGSAARVGILPAALVSEQLKGKTFQEVVSLFRLLRRHFGWSKAMVEEAIGAISVDELIEQASNSAEKDLKEILAYLSTTAALEVCFGARSVEGLQERILWLVRRCAEARQVDAFHKMLENPRTAEALNAAPLSKISALLLRMRRVDPEMADKLLPLMDWARIIERAQPRDAVRVARVMRAAADDRRRVAIAAAISPDVMERLIDGATSSEIKKLENQLKISTNALTVFEPIAAKRLVSLREQRQRTDFPVRRQSRVPLSRPGSAVAKLGDFFPDLPETSLPAASEEPIIDRLVNLMFKEENED